MAMGYKREQFQVILVQLVNLMRGANRYRCPPGPANL